MPQTVLVMTDNAHPPAAVTTQLATMHAANTITMIYTGGLNPAEQAAALWAQQNGIPWLARGIELDAIGLDPFARGVALLNKSNAQSVLAAGVTAKPTATAAAATVKGKSVTKI